MSLVLGVDVGSQSIKAVLVDEDGDVVATGSAALTMVHEHDGWADQDPHTYCTALRDAVRAAAAEGVQADRVVAMGLGSQVDGVVACDADGAPLRPAIIWLDKRATEQCDRLVAAVGIRSARRAHRAGGRRVAQRTEDDVDPRARAAGLAARGSAGAGRIVCAAPPHRHRMRRMPRTRRRRWSTTSPSGDFDTELCEAAGLDPAMLPPVRPSTEVVGTLRARLAAELGLSARCAVVVGTGDEHAASVGAGAIEPGVVVDVTGTAEPVTTVAASPCAIPLAPGGDPRPCGARFVVGRESRIRQRRKHTVARPGLLGVPQGRGVRAGPAGAAGQRRRVVPARAVGVDGTAVERQRCAAPSSASR